MSQAVADAPTKRPKPRTARKIDREVVQALADKGLSTAQIASKQGVDPKTIWRFLHSTEPERDALEIFKKNRADLLAKLQAKAGDVMHRIIDSMDDAFVSALKPHEKQGALQSLNIVAGTAFDKERLDRGQSTANHSILTQVLNGAVKDVYTQPVVVEAQNAAPEHVSPEQTTEQQSRASSGPTTESEG